MANDYGLLGGPQVPMSAARAPVGFDVMEKVKEGYTMAGKGLELAEDKRQLGEAAGDRAALQEAMQSGADFHTPAGLDKTMKDLEGKLSPAGYMNLAKHRDATVKSYGETLRTASQYDLDTLKVQNDGITHAMPLVESLLSHADKLKESGMPPDAVEEQLKAGRAALGTQLRAQKTASGRTLLPEDFINVLETGDMETVRRMHDEHPTHHAAVKEALQLAQEKAALAKAELDRKKAEEQGSYTVLTSKEDPRLYRVSKSGKAEIQTGPNEWAPTMKLPGDVQQAVQAANTKDNRLKQAAEETEKALQHPTQALLDMAINSVVTGDKPAFGSGQSSLRAPYSLLTAKMRANPENIALVQEYKANQASLSNITKTSDVITANEKTATNLLNRVMPMLEKGATSPTDIKLVNEWVTKFKRAIGNADVAEIDIYQKAIQADVARIQSGVSGAGQTPVAFLHAGEVILPIGLPKAAYPQILEAIKADMQSRRTANDAQRTETAKRTADNFTKVKQMAYEAAKQVSSTDLSEYLPPDASPEQKSEARGGGVGAKVDSKVQKERDTERGPILQREYEKKVRDFSDSTDLENKDRIRVDIAALKKEAKAAGVTLSDSPAQKFKEGETKTSKSGKPMVFKNGNWYYQ